jgi:four helix bundle protein
MIIYLQTDLSMKDFKKLKIWQQGMEITELIYDMSASMPNTEKFGLTSQMTRAAVSIPSNIAEGSSRRSEKDYFRFCEIALGSAYELETQLLVVIKRGWIEEPKVNSILNLLTEEQRMLFGFMNKLHT